MRQPVNTDDALTGGSWRPVRGIQRWFAAPTPGAGVTTEPESAPNIDDEWREVMAAADSLIRERYGDQSWFRTPPPVERRWFVEPDDDVTTARRRRELLADYSALIERVGRTA